MSDKNKVEVRIAGKDYNLVGVESDEYIQKIGLYVDKKMNEILKKNNKLSTSMAAVLTALNTADDYMKIKESEEQLNNEIKSMQKEMKKMIEENNKMSKEKKELNKKNTQLQLELAKREAELREVRNSLEKESGSRISSK